jgi:protein involved in sex pheromone biosynthesis
MKKQLFLLLTCTVVSLLACSESSQDTQSKAPQVESTQAQTAATEPSTTSPNMGPPTNGKVIKAMHAGGYTYMQVENQGKQFWVAATMMNVKRDDHVAWASAAVMKNFNSPSLRRTFDEILFVTAAQVE